MTIKQQGGIFGRNPTFNDVDIEGTLTVNGEPISDFGTMAQQDADSVNIDGGSVDGVTLGTNSAVTDARIDNIKIDGNTISSTNTDGNISLTPNGSGKVAQTQTAAKYHITSSHAGYNADGGTIELATATNQYGNAGAQVKARNYGNVNQSFTGVSFATQQGASSTPVDVVHIHTSGTIFPETTNSADLGYPGFYTGTGNEDRFWRHLYLSGNVVVASGQGIDFSATSGTGTSELFDDYEEGTFSPIYEATTSNPSVTYDTTVRFGYYTKIGRTVFISCAIRTDAVSSAGSGNLLIGGLPYAGGGGVANRASFYVGQSAGFNTGYHPMAATLRDNQTQIDLYTAIGSDPRDGIAQNVNASSALVNSANKNELYINGFYTVV